VNVGVPDDYVWDGTEFVGMVGDQYYYLGPDHVWLNFDAHGQARFHDWERNHADWREHATHNDQYRRDAQGHEAPPRDTHPEPRDMHAAPVQHPAPDKDHGQDAGDHHDHLIGSPRTASS
jgi:hypothetical protein